MLIDERLEPERRRRLAEALLVLTHEARGYVIDPAGIAGPYGVFGPEDVPIAGVRVQAPQSQLQGITDERGVAFLPGAPVNTPTDVLVDAATLQPVAAPSASIRFKADRRSPRGRSSPPRG